MKQGSESECFKLFMRIFCDTVTSLWRPSNEQQLLKWRCGRAVRCEVKKKTGDDIGEVRLSGPLTALMHQGHKRCYGRFRVSPAAVR